MRALLISVLLCFMLDSACAKVSLNPSERAWIKAHPIINVAASSEDMPFDFIDDKGEHAGMARDYLDLVREKTGLKFRLKSAQKWNDTLKMLEKGESDLIPYIFHTKHRAQKLHFSQPYVEVREYFITRANEPSISSLASLGGKRLVLIKAYHIVEWIRENYPQIEVITRSSAYECLQALSKGEADVYINERASSLYIINQADIANLKINERVREHKPIKGRMAVREDYKPLAQIISKVIESLTQEEKIAIIQKWRNTKQTRLALNGAFGFGRPPFMYDDVSQVGLEQNIVQKALEASGYTIRKIKQMPQKRGQVALKDDDTLQFSAGVFLDKDDGYYYSKPIIELGNSVISRKGDNVELNSVADLASYKVVAWDGFYKKFHKGLPAIMNPDDDSDHYREFSNEEKALRAFFNKEADIIIIDRNIFEWYKKRERVLEEHVDDFVEHKLFEEKNRLRVAFRNVTHRDHFDAGLEKIKKEKIYDKSYRTFLSTDLSLQLTRMKVIAAISAYYLFEDDIRGLNRALRAFESSRILSGVEIIDADSKSTVLFLEKREGRFKRVQTPSIDQSISLSSPSYYRSRDLPVRVGTVKLYYQLNEHEQLRFAYLPKLDKFKDLKAVEREHIKKVYEYFDLTGQAFNLSPQEQAWIANAQPIDIGVDPHWLPNEAFNKKGEFIGIVSDYLKRIEIITGLKFKPVYTSWWSETLALAQDRKIEMVSSPMENDTLKLWYTPSQTYLENPLAIIMNEKEHFVSSIQKLKGKRIAIPQGAANTKRVVENYPELDFILTKSTVEAISGVSINKYDAAIVSFNVASYEISIKGYSTLKIVGKLKESSNMCFFVQKENPVLLSIINKALTAITQEEKDAIVEKWIQQKYVEKTDYTLVYQIIGLSIFLLLVFYFWNRKLSAEIKARQEAEEALADQLQYQRTLLDVMPNPVFTKNTSGVFTACNMAFKNAFGLSSEEVVGKNIIEVNYLSMQERKNFHDKDREIIRSKKEDTTEAHLPFSDGQIHDVILQRKVFEQADGKVGGLLGVMTDVSELKYIQKELEERNDLIQSSIEYASLIQQALLPEKQKFQDLFKDSFVIWKPRDVVGGDIYFVEELRQRGEYLIMMVDCTGHGVPGAFVTMLVKALERNIVSYVNSTEEEISPARALRSLNRSVKRLLQQEDKSSKSNAGFDAGILYINKKRKILRYAGAEVPLYYFKDEELHTIKGDRQSIGYVSSDVDYEFKEYELAITPNMRLFLTTDGYVDQNGGEKGFPFGKKRFKTILQQEADSPMSEIKEALMQALELYQGEYETNDDITLMGLCLGADEKGCRLLEYRGEIHQQQITDMTQELEKRFEFCALGLKLSTDILTVFIELAQNMMNYALVKEGGATNSLEILEASGDYLVLSKNLVKNENKKKIQAKLETILCLDKEGLRNYYRQMRKEGSERHEKGAGIGFIEIARRCKRIEYSFEDYDEECSYFLFKSVI